MNSEQFNKVFESRIQSIRDRFKSKSCQYSSEYDVLSHFKRVAGVLTTSPETALIGESVKHLVKILQTVDCVESNHMVSIDEWNEILTDFMVYLMLLDGQLYERFWT